MHAPTALFRSVPCVRCPKALSAVLGSRDSSLRLVKCSTHEQTTRGRTPRYGSGSAASEDAVKQKLLRKEVIQPHLPVRLPCYDLVLITDPTFDSSLLAVGPLASGVTDFHDLTGGVYKARERIHRGVADPRLLATPTS